MDRDALGSLYDEVVEQIRDHLHRGDTVAEAQENHTKFCSDIIAAVPSMEIMKPFLKDIILGFADKFKWNDCDLLDSLLDGTDSSQLAIIRTAGAVTISQNAVIAWKHVVSVDSESAVTIIAISYRLSVEKKLQKLLTAEKTLEKSHKIQTQEETV